VCMCVCVGGGELRLDSKLGRLTNLAEELPI
jgi:hypothetical protein